MPYKLTGTTSSTGQGQSSGLGCRYNLYSWVQSSSTVGLRLSDTADWVGPLIFVFLTFFLTAVMLIDPPEVLESPGEGGGQESWGELDRSQGGCWGEMVWWECWVRGAWGGKVARNHIIKSVKEQITLVGLLQISFGPLVSFITMTGNGSHATPHLPDVLMLEFRLL